MSFLIELEKYLKQAPIDEMKKLEDEGIDIGNKYHDLTSFSDQDERERAEIEIKTFIKKAKSVASSLYGNKEWFEEISNKALNNPDYMFRERDKEYKDKLDVRDLFRRMNLLERILKIAILDPEALEYEKKRIKDLNQWARSGGTWD